MFHKHTDKAVSIDNYNLNDVLQIILVLEVSFVKYLMVTVYGLV